ncbi:hypothetical protein, partial [Dyella sp.]|uniref:hypothetical protein n=1 Tax=Dyella sp. TaxID=1869338 RepID=UPI002ED5EEF1
PVDVVRLQVWRSRLRKVRAMTFTGPGAKQNKGRQSRLIGLIFERLLATLMIDGKLFTGKTNVHTTTSEIDLLMQLGPIAASVVPYLQDVGAMVLGEAKCVKGGIQSGWVQKLAGIMATHNTKFAILFTEGTAKKVPPAIRTALSLHYVGHRRIVPFGSSQLDAVISGESFLGVLAEQHTKVALHSTTLST